MTTLHVVTANTPGAIALIQLHGNEVAQVLADLTGQDDWPPGRVRLCDFAGIDEGLAVVASQSPERKRGDGLAMRRGPVANARGSKQDTAHHETCVAQLMPHGGPRVVQRLVERLVELGCAVAHDPDPRATYPEARSHIEADVLHAIALAVSPAAIDLLADQPARWQRLLALPQAQRDAQRGAIRERSATLSQLITPPTVVVAGPANVGKSTLTNALMGRAVSIVADLPGTTRDWVGAVVELVSGPGSGVSGLDNKEGRARHDNAATPRPQTPGPAPEIAVRWLDTPGLRSSDDTVEQRAIRLARSVVEGADVLIAMRDADSDWPGGTALPRTPDLWVINKCDRVDERPASPTAPPPGSTPDHPLHISAEHGHGLCELQHAVLAQLDLATLDDETPWAFSPTLQAWAAGERVDLSQYLST